MILNKLLKKNASAYVICAVMITVLTAPILTLSLPSGNVNVAAIQDEVAMDSQIDYEPQDTYFDPSEYDVLNYVRDDVSLTNRGSESEDLLFGSVDAGSAEAGITPPADMTFTEDNTTVYLNSDGVNMREFPTTESSILRKCTLSEAVTRTGVNAEWIRIVDSQGVIGYISAEFISDKKPTPTPTPKPKVKTATVKSSAPAIANSLGESIAQEAQKYLGVRYRGGYADPGTGFDCSGLTWYVFNRYGISTPRGTSSYYGAGIVIPYSQIAPGDVISWDTRKYDNRTTITHVGIYIGNGMMVHASSSNSSVTKVSVSQYSAWGCKIISVHRFIKA